MLMPKRKPWLHDARRDHRRAGTTPRERRDCPTNTFSGDIHTANILITKPVLPGHAELCLACPFRRLSVRTWIWMLRRTDMFQVNWLGRARQVLREQPSEQPPPRSPSSI